MSAAYSRRVDEHLADFPDRIFPNAAAERQQCADLEHQVRQFVRPIELHVIGHAKTLTQRLHDARRQADEIRHALGEMQFALRDDEDIDLDRWSVLDGQIDRLVVEAERYAPRVEALKTRLADPVAYVGSLQARFPALHRPDFTTAVVHPDDF